MNISTTSVPNAPRERFEVEQALQGVEELWQPCFGSGGGSFEFHYLNEYGQELGSETIAIPAGPVGAWMVMPSIPTGQKQTYRVEAYCLNRPIRVGMSGAADNVAPHTAQYTQPGATMPEILYPGDKLTWGIRSGPRIERAYASPQSVLDAQLAAAINTADALLVFRDIRRLLEIQVLSLPVNDSPTQYPQ